MLDIFSKENAMHNLGLALKGPWRCVVTWAVLLQVQCVKWR